ncbi:hypothetical protein HNY73_020143 [Argiope bruennichi]|uniref:Uncharacterized protein n=1 Tax=Argiope bruennichi TaxID=94029 RepID=A0A8T0E8E8_ARGBR|nr:hypothetical protein HNY73_020143 [Argiope bruennichi]
MVASQKLCLFFVVLVLGLLVPGPSMTGVEAMHMGGGGGGMRGVEALLAAGILAKLLGLPSQKCAFSSTSSSSLGWLGPWTLHTGVEAMPHGRRGGGMRESKPPAAGILRQALGHHHTRAPINHHHGHTTMG